MEDMQIIALYFARNEEAIRETDSKYRHLCWRIAHNILTADSDIEECINDTYLGAWNAIPPQIPDHFAAFLCRITRNLSLNRVRSNTVFKRSVMTEISLSELEEILPDQNTNPLSDLSGLEALLNRFLRDERREIRYVFIRKYWFFDSISDIAQHLGCSESKVKSILHRTRKKLREYLKKEGIYL